MNNVNDIYILYILIKKYLLLNTPNALTKYSKNTLQSYHNDDIPLYYV